MTEGIDILLVEDNPDDLDLALLAFERHKLANRIRVARDGAEALDLVVGRQGSPGLPADGQPKVILLDLKLPKVDGLDVLRAIRAHEASRHTPVVVLTSSHEDQDVVESYELGVNAYIVKPVDFDKFVETARVLGLFWLLMNERPHRRQDA